MPSRFSKKSVIVLNTCFTTALVTIAFLFSSFLEWRGESEQYTALVPLRRIATDRALTPQVQPVQVRWERVEGAKAYRVQAWQMIGSKKTMLFDATVPTTEARISRIQNGEFYWQVAAVDASGRSGEVAGPVVWHERRPASK